VALSATVCISDLIQQPGSLFEHFADVAFTISSLVSLLSMSGLEIIDTATTSPLERYASEHGFVDSWVNKGACNIVLVMCVWLFRAVSCVTKFYVLDKSLGAMEAVTLLAHIFQVGLYLALVHSMYQMVIFIKLSLDAYMVSFYEHSKFSEGILSWNILMALIHDVSTKIDSCFLAVQTSAVVAFLCCAARVLDMVLSAPKDLSNLQLVLVCFDISSLAMVIVGTFMLLAKSVSITETCALLPQVVNSLQVPETPVNYDRESMVSFIINSQPGFRVKGTQLNATFLLNYCYLCGAIVCGIFTTGLSLSQK